MKRDLNLVRLSRDHQRGLALAQRIQRGLPKADAGTVERLSEQARRFWQDGLLPHFHAECECLLARLVRHAPASGDLVQRTQSDHLRVHAIMASLQDEREAAGSRVLLQQLSELLYAHIRWEEAVLFEAVQQELLPAELSALGAELEQRLAETPPPLEP